MNTDPTSPASSGPVIAHLLSNRWNSAITEYAVHAARALGMAGIPQVFVALKGSAGARRAAAAGLEVVEVERFSLMQLPDVTRAIRSERLRAVFVYGGAETFLAKWLKGSFRNLKVIRFRGDDRDATRKTDGLLQQLSQSHIDLFLAPSDFIASRLDGRARKVEPGIDPERIHRVSPADPGPGARRDCVILGRLDPVKGHDLFFRVFAQMLATHGPDAYSLRVVGEPANLSLVHLEHKAREAGLTPGKNVFFTTDRVEDISGLLSSACAGIVCSAGSEIICRVAQEFLVCGTPVAVSGVGSLAEIPVKGDGIVYGAFRSPVVEEKLWDFLECSRQETKDQREARAARSLSRFSLESMSRHLVDVLSSLGISLP